MPSRAVMPKNFDIVCLPLAKAADINVQDQYGWTALVFATCDGNFAITQLLVKHGAPVKTTTNDGWTTLDMIAAEKSKDKATLLDEEAELDAENSSSYNILFIAI